MITMIRVIKGVARLRVNDPKYFVGDAGAADRPSHFRQDLRAIVGGALAAAFVASALSGYVEIPHISDSFLTLIAGILGAVGAKYILV